MVFLASSRLRMQLEDHVHCPFPQFSRDADTGTTCPNLPRGHSLQGTLGSPEHLRRRLTNRAAVSRTTRRHRVL
jgi:hypothetical protein